MKTRGLCASSGSSWNFNFWWYRCCLG